MSEMKRCPLQVPHGDKVCIDGLLWALTYSDCAPPDQRQCVGECPHCHAAKVIAAPGVAEGKHE
jgi:hypothetical protein